MGSTFARKSTLGESPFLSSFSIYKLSRRGPRRSCAFKLVCGAIVGKTDSVTRVSIAEVDFAGRTIGPLMGRP